MPSYLKLNPLDMNTQTNIVIEMLNFFSLDNAIMQDGKNIPHNIFDFTKFYKEKYSFDLGQYKQFIEKIIKTLHYHGFLTAAGSRGFTGGLEQCFYQMITLSNIQKQGNFWMTEILGFERLIYRIEDLMVQITGKTNNGDVACGSGILVNKNTILTCSHNLSDMTINSSQYIGKQEVRVTESKYHQSIDVGYIIIEGDFGHLTKGVSFLEPIILDKILVAGFPKIPHSKNPELVYQTGEVNSFMDDFSDNKLFLYSAYTRPGNSGGPIFNEKGNIVGVVTRDFTGKYQDMKSGDEKISFPFCSGVPTSEIVKALGELNPNIVIPIENYE